MGTAKVVEVLNFPAGIVGVNGVMRFLVLVEPMSADGRQHSSFHRGHQSRLCASWEQTSNEG